MTKATVTRLKTATRGALDEYIENQRTRLFRAQAMTHLAADSLRRNFPGAGHEASAVEEAVSILGQVLECLDSVNLPQAAQP